MAKIIRTQKTAEKPLVARGIALAAVLGLIVCLSAPAGADTLSYNLQADPWIATSDDKGFDRVTLDDFMLRGMPGNPLLPVKEYRILLPPDADFSTVRVTAVPLEPELLPGLFKIAPAAPDSASIEGRIVHDWGGATNIVDGKNMDIYCVNAFFPPKVIRRAPNAEMRKYRFIRVEFHPIQYNPVTKHLRYTRTAVIDIHFERMDQASDISLVDTVLDKEAPELFYNYEEAKAWYTPLSGGDDEPSTMYDYEMVIITTNTIRSKSTKFNDFVTSKRARGISLWIITEDTYGMFSGTQRADKIRNWLKYALAYPYHITHVLLIGDPTPGGTGVDAVPMKTCLPGIDTSQSP